MSKIIITKPGTIPADKQSELKEAGYIVVEAANPKDIVLLDETPSLERDILLDAAINALDHGNEQSGRLAFGNLIRNGLKDKK